MSVLSKSASLSPEGLQGSTRLYRLRQEGFSNNYYVLSSPLTRRMMAFPEVVGLDSGHAPMEATEAALRYLGIKGSVDILTILRGGLNYPVEEACHACGVPVKEIHFLSCERKIRNHVIEGLEIKYEKVNPGADRTLVMGDIIATGDTLRMCMEAFSEIFSKRGGSLKRVVFFTVGGTRAIGLMEKLTEKFRTLFPGFEGFDCFFYEGIFTVYEDLGVSGINIPDIDFGWKGGAVAPEFRSFVMDHPDALLERCIIYDGGARRYEIPVHIHEVKEYWEGIMDRASVINPEAFVEEKLGYAGMPSYEDWLRCTHLQDNGLRDLWARETALRSSCSALDIKALAERRILSMENLNKQYE